jgi:hypothetical protein
MGVSQSQSAVASHFAAIHCSMAFADASPETTVRIPVEVIVTGNAPELRSGRQVSGALT